MKIDKNDFERVMSKVDIPIDKKRITDPEKYWYWHTKSSEYIDCMDNNRDNKHKYNENFHHALLCEFEKNKYCRINKKEFILLYTLVRYHNSIHEDKLYFNEKGLRVKRYDRRAVRIDTTSGEFAES